MTRFFSSFDSVTMFSQVVVTVKSNVTASKDEVSRTDVEFHENQQRFGLSVSNSDILPIDLFW